MSRVIDAKPELLAPVGSPEALLAAVRCGADAVYLGAGRFHARQHASPFDDAALRETIDYCHERGVAVHMTLNTLVREDEFEDALTDAKRAYAWGADALIVQDRGLAAAVREVCPSMTLHASTQLSCHTVAGVKALAAEGFDRVVLAREMTRDEIAACCATGVEIETFVHGALCMSVSGQCFLSALLGGRSGNRGQCAQPCRLPFAVNAAPSETDRQLSLKDLSLFDRVRDLAEIGVTSLKIEGRMKRPEYVAAAVTVCRAALDGRPVDQTLLDDLCAVFSRSGFTDGYYTGKRTVAMFGSRTKDDVLAAPAANKRLSNLYHKEIARIPVTATLNVAKDTPVTLLLDDGTHTVQMCGEPPRESGDAASPAERIETAVKQCGGTPFVVQAVEVLRESGVDVPLSAVKALRREAVEALLAARRTKAPRAVGAFTPEAMPPYVRETAKPQLVVRLQNVSQWHEALCEYASLVTLPLLTSSETLAAITKKMPVAVEVPRGIFGSESRVIEALKTAKQCGVKAAVAHTVDAVALCRAAEIAVIGGYGLHTANDETLRVHVRKGLCAATLSFDPAVRQPYFGEEAPLPVGRVVYGHLPLMLLRNCPASARQGCKTCKQDRVLIDRKGKAFPLVCQNGCADVLNVVPLCLTDQRAMWEKLSFETLYMTTESAERVAALTQLHSRVINGETIVPSDICPDGFTRGK